MSKIDEKALTVIRRRDARQAGQTRYFTGKPCPKGHISERHVADKKCVACKKQVLLEKYKTDSRYKANHAEVMRNYLDKDPRKKNAQLQVQNAVRDGRLEKLPCERCGDEKSEGHHEDYSKPLDVIWLCRRHHRERHREIRHAA